MRFFFLSYVPFSSCLRLILLLLLFNRNVDNLTRKTSKTVAETAALAGDLFYSCNIDNASEAQIVDAVHLINYSIDELISNILYGVEKSKLSYRSSRNRDTPTTKSDSSGITSIALWSILMDFRPSHHATRDLVVEAVLHNLVSSLIHKYFFKGGHFFGVGSEALRENLEIMLSKLVAGGKYSFFIFFNLFVFY